MSVQILDFRFSVGDEVRIEVDGARRMLHARLHSAGHLLDSALDKMGMLTDLVPYKVSKEDSVFPVHCCH